MIAAQDRTRVGAQREAHDRDLSIRPMRFARLPAP